VFVEAVVATDETPVEAAKGAVLATFFDEVNRLDSPSFFIGIRRLTNPTNRQPPARRLRAFLKKELCQLDPDAVSVEAEASGGRHLQSLTFVDGDFVAEIDVIPKAPEARGKQGVRPLGTYPWDARWGGTGGAIKAALTRKASRYGSLQLPYILAVNVMSKWGFDRRDVAEALFGLERHSLAHGSLELQITRNPDGLWYGPRGPRNRRVSAVMTTSVLPSNLSAARLCIYHNPFARFAVTEHPWPCDVATVRLIWEDGKPIGDLLDLPAIWPGPLMEPDA
jgi:hypothetical protein